MVKYTCSRCQKQFDKKDSYNKHLRRIKPCGPKPTKISLLVQNENPIQALVKESTEAAFHFANCHGIYGGVDTIITYTNVEEKPQIIEIRKIYPELFHTLPVESDYDDYLNGSTSAEFNHEIYEKLSYRPLESSELIESAMKTIQKHIQHVKYQFTIDVRSTEHPYIDLRIRDIGLMFYIAFKHSVTFSETAPTDDKDVPNWSLRTDIYIYDAAPEAQIQCTTFPTHSERGYLLSLAKWDCGRVIRCSIELSDTDAHNLYARIKEYVTDNFTNKENEWYLEYR